MCVFSEVALQENQKCHYNCLLSVCNYIYACVAINFYRNYFSYEVSFYSMLHIACPSCRCRGYM